MLQRPFIILMLIVVGLILLTPIAKGFMRRMFGGPRKRDR
jgi:hypothetical protein